MAVCWNDIKSGGCTNTACGFEHPSRRRPTASRATNASRTSSSQPASRPVASKAIPKGFCFAFNGDGCFQPACRYKHILVVSEDAFDEPEPPSRPSPQEQVEPKSASPFCEPELGDAVHALDVAFAHRDWARCMAAASNVIKLDPSRPRAWYLRAMSRYYLGVHCLALEDAHRVPYYDPACELVKLIRRQDDLFDAGRAAAEAGDWILAIGLLDQLIEQDPQHQVLHSKAALVRSRARLLAIESHIKTGSVSDLACELRLARRDATAYIASFPDDHKGYRRRASVLESCAQLAGGSDTLLLYSLSTSPPRSLASDERQAIAQLVELGKEDISTALHKIPSGEQVLKAQVETELMRHELVVRLHTFGTATNPFSMRRLSDHLDKDHSAAPLPLLLRLAVIDSAYQDRDWGRAVKLASELILYDPEVSPVYAYRACASARRSNKFTDVFSDINSALKLSCSGAPWRPLLAQKQAHYIKIQQLWDLANENFKHGKWSEAKKTYTVAVESASAGDAPLVMSSLLSNRANTNLKMRLLDDAIRDAEAAIKLNQDNFKAHRLGGKIHAINFHWQEASSAFSLAFALASKLHDETSDLVTGIKLELDIATASARIVALLAQKDWDTAEAELQKLRKLVGDQQEAPVHWAEWEIQIERGERTHYTRLGVTRDATTIDIRKAYKKAALIHHPDTGGSEARFKQLQNAYDILIDPYRRREYDYELDRRGL